MCWNPKIFQADRRMNTLTLPCDSGKVSDGYHSFDDLYDHRNMLWLYIVNSNLEAAFKTKLDDKGESLPGWFIAGINTDAGQITYHLPKHLWNKYLAEVVSSNKDYDGHTSADVLHRLEQLAVPF